MSTERPKPRPGYSHLTLKLITLLESGKPGDVITDEELLQSVGADCSPNGRLTKQPRIVPPGGVVPPSTGAGYTHLLAAIKFCVRAGVVWQRVRGEGCIECLSSSGVIDAGQSYRLRGARAARRALGLLSAVDPDKIVDLDERRRHTQEAALAGVMAAVGSRRAVNAIKDADDIADAQARLYSHLGGVPRLRDGGKD